MNSRARSEVDSSTSSKGFASALKASVDLSLVAEADGRVPSSNPPHSKSTINPEVLSNLSATERARALRLAERLASSHSD